MEAKGAIVLHSIGWQCQAGSQAGAVVLSSGVIHSGLLVPMPALTSAYAEVLVTDTFLGVTCSDTDKRST